MEFLEQITYWQWWMLGVILVIIEVFSPGAFFIWMGAAAGVVGLVLMIFPGMPWEFQMLIFAGFSVISIVLWRQYQKKHPTETDQPRLNRRGEQYIDRVFTLNTPIVDGQGKIQVDDSTWKVAGEDCPEGTKVVVTGVEGVVLQVKVLQVKESR
jgi:membrane protein implicated in regulation of membrane protease activity